MQHIFSHNFISFRINYRNPKTFSSIYVVTSENLNNFILLKAVYYNWIKFIFKDSFTERGLQDRSFHFMITKAVGNMKCAHLAKRATGHSFTKWNRMVF